MKQIITYRATQILKGLYVTIWTALVFFSLYYVDLDDLYRYRGTDTHSESPNEEPENSQSTEITHTLFHANFEWGNEVSSEMKQDKIFIPFFIAIIMMFFDFLYSYIVDTHRLDDKDVFSLIGGIIALFLGCLLIGLTKTLGSQCLIIISMFFVLGFVKASRTPARACADILPSQDWKRIDQKRKEE